MKRRSKKFIATIVAGFVVAAVVPAVVVASIVTNATAVAVNVTTKLKASNSVAQFTGTSGPLNGVVATCTAVSSTLQVSTKGGGLGPLTITPPKFTGCTDNLGGTDTITSNSTNGPWTSTYVNSPGKPTPDQIKIGVPTAGQTLVSTFAPACTITLNPTGGDTVSGNYDNAGNLTISGQTIHYSAAGTCPTGTGSGTATFSVVLKSGGTGTPELQISPPVVGIP